MVRFSTFLKKAIRFRALISLGKVLFGQKSSFTLLGFRQSNNEWGREDCPTLPCRIAARGRSSRSPPTLYPPCRQDKCTKLSIITIGQLSTTATGMNFIPTTKLFRSKLCLKSSDTKTCALVSANLNTSNPWTLSFCSATFQMLS